MAGLKVARLVRSRGKKIAGKQKKAKSLKVKIARKVRSKGKKR